MDNELFHVDDDSLRGTEEFNVHSSECDGQTKLE